MHVIVLFSSSNEYILFKNSKRKTEGDVSTSPQLQSSVSDPNVSVAYKEQTAGDPLSFPFCSFNIFYTMTVMSI